MARRLFVDSSGWYALIDRRDAWHAMAVRQVEEQVEAGGRLVTTDYVIDESCTLVQARIGHVAALRLLDLLRQTEGVDWEWITPDRFARAEALFRKYRDQGYSFTDCSSFSIMRELRLERAITSDAHFRSAGFQASLARR
jgi:predicted nucleic acid-binding protein